MDARLSVIYSSAPGYRPLELDLYAPAGAWETGAPTARHPTVVWIHGGAFAMGSRRLLPEFLAEADFFRRLTREGFVVASIDYRLSSESIWPAPLLDVRTALRWLRSRAAELAIDVGSIVTWGESAGAHLAAMAGMVGSHRLPAEADGLPAPEVAAVVDWYGPTNFAAMDRQSPPDSAMSHDDPDSPESRLLGAPVQTVPDRVADADPATYAKPGLPPVMIHHGRADRLVPFGQSEILADALTRAGSAVRFRPVDGAGHVFEGHPNPAVFLEDAIAFLHEVLPRRSGGRRQDRNGARPPMSSLQEGATA